MLALTLTALAGTGCANSRGARRTAASSPVEAPARHEAPQAAVPQPPGAVAQTSQAAGVRLASATQPVLPAPLGRAEELPAPVPSDGVLRPVESFPIDLPTALQLADAGAYQVLYAREQIRQSWAKVEAADALWLPSIRGGVNYNKHDGQIQDIEGNVFPVSRNALYAGMGAGAVGAASPMVPGLYANFHFADAYFQPLAARQYNMARRSAAQATTNDVLLNVSLGYLDLLRATEEVRIANATWSDSDQLTELTAEYAKTGRGLRSDADRAAADLAIRRNEITRAEESLVVSSARLAQVLRLDPMVQLTPAEQAALPIALIPLEAAEPELVAQGLTLRPELSEARYLVGQAIEKMRRERCAVLIPSVILGASYGGFGGGTGSSEVNFDDRMDMDAIAYWEVRNFGCGERAARDNARSVVRQADIQRLLLMDQVAREVVEARTQVVSRNLQIKVARQGLEVANSSHRRNIDRILGGEGLPIEALQSIQALNQARREYLRTVIDYNVAQFTLYRALGAPGGPVIAPPPLAEALPGRGSR